MSKNEKPPNSTRERILDATVELLRIKGPTATGTQEILERASAPRGSFYFHFPAGKDQLVGEAVQRAAAATAAGILTALKDHSVPLPGRIEKLFTSVAEALTEDDYRLGCAVGATVLEASATSDSLRLLAAAAFGSWASVLTEHFVADGIAETHAVELADNVIVALEGATMLSRSRRDMTPLRQAGVMLATAGAELTGQA